MADMFSDARTLSSHSHCLGRRPPSSSIGRGKMMVEFFSAEIEERVWRYLENWTRLILIFFVITSYLS